jgi:hypothetical protein
MVVVAPGQGGADFTELYAALESALPGVHSFLPVGKCSRKTIPFGVVANTGWVDDSHHDEGNSANLILWSTRGSRIGKQNLSEKREGNERHGDKNGRDGKHASV